MLGHLRSFAKKNLPASLQPAAFTERYLQCLRRDDHIRAGPFQGLRFTWENWDDNFSIPQAKFLGTYELELISTIEKLLSQPFARFVDVGAAEGYYALGWARRCPQVHVVAFEMLPPGRDVMARLAQANGVSERFDIRGKCEPADLADALSAPGATLLMMDVEGYEDVLLDPVLIPALQHTTILVEAHDCYVPGVGEKICARFRDTHFIHKISSRGRFITDLKTVNPFLKLYAKHNLLGWMGERQFDMAWYYLTPAKPARA